jgi:hypothetical protein
MTNVCICDLIWRSVYVLPFGCKLNILIIWTLLTFLFLLISFSLSPSNWLLSLSFYNRPYVLAIMLRVGCFLFEWRRLFTDIAAQIYLLPLRGLILVRGIEKEWTVMPSWGVTHAQSRSLAVSVRLKAEVWLWHAWVVKLDHYLEIGLWMVRNDRRASSVSYVSFLAIRQFFDMFS